MCYTVDTEDGTGENVCLQCIVVATDVAWDRPSGPKGIKPRPEPEALWGYEDDACPDRGPGLSHTVRDRGFNCIHCGIRTYRRRRAS